MVDELTRGIDLVLDDGTPVLVKRVTGSRVHDLQAEAERLRRAIHPGVVSLLHSGGDASAWELHLAHAGRPVSLVRPVTPDQVAGLVAATAAIVADLHDQGIVHGRIDAAHVLVGPEGRIRLCGLGPEPSATPPDDVAALGALLVDLLGDREELEPLPERRWCQRRTWSGVTRRSLLTIADQAAAEPPSRRPSARRLAASIAAAVPSARLHLQSAEGADRARPSKPGPAHRAPVEAVSGRSLSSGRWPAPWLLAAVAGIGLLVLAMLRLLGSPDLDGDGLAAPSTCVRLPGDEELPASTSPCVEPVIEGTSVFVGTSRFEVGEAGDRLTLGDWDCDGTATPAVLRPSTGEVFVFPRWPNDDDLRVPARTKLPEAVQLVASPDPDRPSCTILVAQLADGTQVDVLGGLA